MAEIPPPRVRGLLRRLDVQRVLVWVAIIVAGYAATEAHSVASGAHRAATAAGHGAQNASRAARGAHQLAAGASATAQSLSALTARVAGDERESCLIQRAQLPAGRALDAVMFDIHALLTLPRTRAERRAQGHLPRREKRLIRRLDRSLATFNRLERATPPTRTC